MAQEGVLSMLRETLDDLVLAPAGTPADRIILDMAKEEKGFILSNDMFRDWRRRSSWCKRNIHRLRVPLISRADVEEAFSFGEPGVELRSPPPKGTMQLDGTLREA
ncbi:MAG: hypothetical protein EA427_00680 [Spirochaetaceae bacterium]|nr:MAG: hypothetical protein EA427_00680 [Spirochaetaceae bacterium]